MEFFSEVLVAMFFAMGAVVLFRVVLSASRRGCGIRRRCDLGLYPKEENMKTSIPLWCAILAALAGCTFSVPYRNGNYIADASCEKSYGDYDATLVSDSEPIDIDESDRCWNHSRERHRDYDLLFVEFDDQGWVQGAAEQSVPVGPDHLSKLYATIEEIHKGVTANGEHLRLVLFVHGWQHNAQANDSNVHSFRKLLREISVLENNTRVVGIYIGWRGKSLTIPYVNNVTFWERKNTAERVAQGGVQELLRWLDLLRDTGVNKNGERNVGMLTIGHSFGGLITFEALSGELLRNSVRFKRNEAKPKDPFMSRVGDLVVIVNPAFEGARYESLRSASRRLPKMERNQLPVVIVATSESDCATRVAFPLARGLNTVFESTTGEEWWATVAAVGHNARYITHELSRCESNDAACQKACGTPTGPTGVGAPNKFETEVSRDYAHMSEIAKKGFDAGKPKPSRQYLCGGLDLRWTEQAYPDHNPFWVVRTTKDIMKDHGDIFNPAMVAFVRQMYIGFIAARDIAKQNR
jgi:pimeloyl-ACP methyl ester carboxylesterase